MRWRGAPATGWHRCLIRLREDGVLAVFHYIPLHTSPMGESLGHRPGELPVTEDVSGRLLRLPFYFELSDTEQSFVVDRIRRHLAP